MIVNVFDNILCFVFQNISGRLMRSQPDEGSRM